MFLILDNKIISDVVFDNGLIADYFDIELELLYLL
jgi:hypothetical protein